MEYLRQRREEYRERYLNAIRDLRERGHDCHTEVWLQPQRPVGDEGVAPLCVDILVSKSDGKREHWSVNAEEAPEGEVVGVWRVGQVDVKVFPLTWEALLVWVHHPEPDWCVLDSWRQRWMDPDQEREKDENGLDGVAHFLSEPVAEGGGWLMEVDLGSAPVEALVELMEKLVAMGADEAELGRSDGSDLDAAALEVLREPELSYERFAEMLTQLVAKLPEVARSQRVAEDEIGMWAADAKDNEKPSHLLYTMNLYARLGRVGVEARAREVLRFLRGQRESFVIRDSPDLSQLRPVIKDDRFLMSIQQNMNPGGSFLAKRLVADLWVCCVWDTANGIQFVHESAAEEYGLSPDEMYTRALKNRAAEHRTPQLVEHGPILLARTEDAYDAAMLLDDPLWDEMAGKVKGEIIACAPARDFLLVGGLGTQGALEAMAEAARRISAGGDHLISETILMRRQGRWERLRSESSISQQEQGASEREVAPVEMATVKIKRPWWKLW
jgi:hypothetical protein